MLLAASTTDAQDRPVSSVSGLDLGSNRVVSVSGLDLGSTRIAQRFLLSASQKQQIRSNRRVTRMVADEGSEHVTATSGYTLHGAPAQNGVVDCTRRDAICVIRSNAPDGLQVFVRTGITDR